MCHILTPTAYQVSGHSLYQGGAPEAQRGQGTPCSHTASWQEVTWQAPPLPPPHGMASPGEDPLRALTAAVTADDPSFRDQTRPLDPVSGQDWGRASGAAWGRRTPSDAGGGRGGGALGAVLAPFSVSSGSTPVFILSSCSSLWVYSVIPSPTPKFRPWITNFRPFFFSDVSIQGCAFPSGDSVGYVPQLLTVLFVSFSSKHVFIFICDFKSAFKFLNAWGCFIYLLVVNSDSMALRSDTYATHALKYVDFLTAGFQVTL